MSPAHRTGDTRGSRQPTMMNRRDLLKVAGLGAAIPSPVVCSGFEAFHSDPAAAAIERGHAFLLSCQHDDGAWRSERYGGFRHGDALTPLALLAMNGLAARHVEERVTDFLSGIVTDAGNRQRPLEHPVYTAAISILALSSLRRNADALLAPWIRLLRKHQLCDDQGWSREDPVYGGWGYATEVPVRPEADQIRQPLLEPNLSATSFALEAIASTAGEKDEAIDRAMPFVNRCHNFAIHAGELPFDDGGFFLVPGSATRNKAGIAGHDRSGRQRFHSYGSATADGLRALRSRGPGVEDHRVQAAIGWFQKYFQADSHPGNFGPQFAPFACGSYFYYCFATARALDSLQLKEIGRASRCSDWRNDMARSLVALQAADGSWSNRSDALREDEPILATSLAVATLLKCTPPSTPQ